MSQDFVKPIRVVSLVNNDCRNDARVIREAEALAEVGCNVLVVANYSSEVPSEERRNGVLYRRVIVPFSEKSIPLNKMVPSSSIPADHNCNTKTFGLNATVDRVSVFAAPLWKFVKETAFGFLKALLTPTVLLLLRQARYFRSPAIKWQPDVVHAHDLYTLFAGWLIARNTKAKLIYDSHELEIGRNAAFSVWEQKVREWSERILIRKTDAVVTVSDSIADFLSERYKIDRPIVVLNAPVIKDFISNADTVRRRIQLENDTPLVLYLGSLTFNRGLEQSLAAMEHSPDWHLVCVGPRVSTIETKLMEQALRLGVSDRIHFVDPVPHDQVTAFVRTADVSLITIQNTCLSYQFCFPNKLLESLLAGLPIVVSRLNELEKMAKRTGAGLIIDETDPREIARAIEEVIANRSSYAPSPELVKELEVEFSWSAQKTKLIDLYKALNVHEKSQMKKTRKNHVDQTSTSMR
ncbi:MAG: glycosyltransferase family 4 protein [Hyphomicrobiaceae bacterium]